MKKGHVYLFVVFSEYQTQVRPLTHSLPALASGITGVYHHIWWDSGYILKAEMSGIANR
jgi:hypothetical protein